MKNYAFAAVAAVTTISAAPVLADGHIQGRLGAWLTVSETPAGENDRTDEGEQSDRGHTTHHEMTYFFL